MQAQLSLISEARQQLALIESCADALLANLSSSTKSKQGRSTAHQNVLQARDAAAKFESTVALLHPSLAASGQAALTPEIVTAAWQQFESTETEKTKSKHEKRQVQVPEHPSKSINDLMNTLEHSFSLKIASQALAGGQDANSQLLAVELGDVFLARIALDSAESMIPLAVDIVPAGSTEETLTTSRRSLYFERLNAAATVAMLQFCEMDEQSRQSASALEMLLVWIAGCAASFTDPSESRHAILGLDPGSGTLVPRIMSPTGYQSWRQLWEAAARQF